MSQLRKIALLLVLSAWFVLGSAAFAAENKRDWLILETTEEGRPVIVRSLNTVPDSGLRALHSWRLTVEWRYQKNDKGLPTEAAIQTAREIEDGLYNAMRKVGPVDLPLVRTGNGVRTWLYYVNDAEKAEKSIRTFLKQRRGLTMVVEASKDSDWLALREVVENVRR